MKKVLLFEDVFGGFGGIEKVILNILKNASKDNFEFSLVVNHMASTEYLPYLTKANVKIYQLQNEFIHNPVKRHLIGFKAFDKFLSENKYFDIAHFHISNGIDLTYCSIAQKKGILKRIVHCHNDGATSLMRLIGHKLFKPFFVNSATDYVACSMSAGKWLFTKKILNSSAFHLISNGIDSTAFAFNEDQRKKKRVELGIQDNDFAIIHVGRFNKQKNQKKVLAIFQELHKQLPQTKLYFFGYGNHDSCSRFILKNHLSDSIFIHNPVLNINEYLNAFDCFLFPSLYEGFGIAVIEAEANGLPCVVSNKIPNFIYFSPKLTSLSLNESNTKWVQAILCTKRNGADFIQECKKRGFDDQIQAKEILNLYGA